MASNIASKAKSLVVYHKTTNIKKGNSHLILKLPTIFFTTHFSSFLSYHVLRFKKLTGANLSESPITEYKSR